MAGLVFAANFYYELDTATVKLEEKKEISISSTAAALTVNQSGNGNIVEFKDAGTPVFTIADGGNVSIVGNVTLAADKWLRLTGAGTLPATSTAAEGQMFFSTSTHQLYIFDSSKWQADRTVVTKIVAANDSQNKEKADYVCDGVDDHVQIQAAIDALPATGGEVRLLDGTYNVEATINLDSNQTLRGDGRNTILTTSTDGLIFLSAVGGAGTEKTGIIITDLQLDGGTSYLSDASILFSYVDYSFIQNVHSRRNQAPSDGYWDGIYLELSDFNTLIGNTCQENGSGINLNASNNNTLIGNTSQGNGDGIALDTSDNNIISGNTCQGNENGITIYASDNNTISGNTSQGNSSAGIELHTSNNNTISGNTSQGNGDICIDIEDTSNNNTILGNTCQENGSYGIYLYTSDNNTISDNTLTENSQDTDNTYDDIYLSESDHNNIQGNTCRAGALANVPRYGINISDAASDGNLVVNNDIYDDDFGTGSFNNSGTGTVIYGNRTGAGATEEYIFNIKAASANTALTVIQSETGTIANFSNATSSIFTIANNGDITTGVWKGTAIGSAYGGTGTSTISWTGVPYIDAGVWGTTTAPTISGGQTNYLPLWTSDTALGTSTIYQLGTNIGIGTTEPAEKLTVIGNTFLGGNSNTITSSASPIFTTTVDSAGDVGRDTSLALGSDGFARISYCDYDNEDLKFVQCTNDDCSTKNITTVDSAGDVGEYTSLAISPDDGYARISYYDLSNSALKFVQCTNDDCSTKSITTVDSAGLVGSYTSIALGSDGFARISYYDNSNYDLKFVQCTNDDCSTKNITTVDSVSLGGTSLALDSENLARISYYDSSSNDLKFVQCTNADCSENNITTVDSAGFVGPFPSLALGSDGFARISYCDYDNYDLKFVQCTNNDCSTKNITTVDSAGYVGEFTSLAISPDDGYARISYYDDGNGDLKFVQCTNDDCSTKSITTVDSAGDVGHDTSLAISPDDGYARISYYNNSNYDLKFARLSDISFNPDNNDLFVAGFLGIEGDIITDGSLLVNQSAKFGNSVLIGGDYSNILTTLTSSWQRTTVDSTGEVGYYTSLAISPDDGYARISYQDDTNGDLKFVQCTNDDCSTKNITTVDSAGYVGEYTSLAINPDDGFARISYYEGDNGYLKFVQCTNDDCSTKNITTVDSAGYVGEYTSLAINPDDGFARISYYDGTNENLKFVQCTNDDCSTKNITTVDTGNVGTQTSLAINPDDGFARISYFDHSGGDLKFVQCTNDDCSTKNITIVDSGNVGLYTSLALGSDGFARISYFDENNEDLKFVQCTNDDCSTKNITTVDSAGYVGEFTSLAISPDDGYARISYTYYDEDEIASSNSFSAPMMTAQPRTSPPLTQQAM